jgi:hypothetical protein
VAVRWKWVRRNWGKVTYCGRGVSIERRGERAGGNGWERGREIKSTYSNQINPSQHHKRKKPAEFSGRGTVIPDGGWGRVHREVGDEEGPHGDGDQGESEEGDETAGAEAGE